MYIYIYKFSILFKNTPFPVKFPNKKKHHPGFQPSTPTGNLQATRKTSIMQASPSLSGTSHGHQHLLHTSGGGEPKKEGSCWWFTGDPKNINLISQKKTSRGTRKRTPFFLALKKCAKVLWSKPALFFFGLRWKKNSKRDSPTSRVWDSLTEN